ncbi:MAG: putative membrane protein YphA (DoxX/SURF4 family) [Alphaproteobacteria bacterium]|jgi:uncharacterized membrane protein YphA (DoxX/SURF4 family)
MKYILILIFVLLTSSGIAHSHEEWILSSDQVTALSNIAPPSIFANKIMLSASLVFGIGMVFLLILSIEKSGFRHCNKRLNYTFMPIGQEYAALIIRLSLGFMLLYASIGALPKLGLENFGHPTLFVPEFDLRLLGETGKQWIFIPYVQLAIAIMLILGIFVRLAIIGVFALIGFGVYFFGINMFDCALHFIAPCLFLLYFGHGHYITSHLPKYNPKIENKIRLIFKWGYLYNIVLIITGITFIYLGISKKVLNPNLIIMVLELANFPNLGLTYDVIALMMAFSEITVGFLLICGLFIRPVAVFLLSVIITFSILLNTPFLFYGNLIGLLLVLGLFGNGTICKNLLHRR